MSTHTNINMSTAASNFAADLSSEPISFPNTDTSIKKSEAAAYFGVGQNRISELALQDGCKFVVFVGLRNSSSGRSLRNFWTSNTPSDTL